MRSTVVCFLKETVENYHDKTAVVEEKRLLTFGELDKKADMLGNMIYERTKSINRPIAVFLPRGIDSIISFAGILYSGNFYVPLDVKSPGKRIKNILDNLNSPLIITLPEYSDILHSIGITKEYILYLDNLYGQCQYSTCCSLYKNIIDTDPVYIIYTSGSTGSPKGVVIPHRGVVDYIEWASSLFEINRDTVIGNQAPFYFDNSTLDIYLCFSTGATMVILPDHLFSFPVKLMEYVNKMAVNFVFWVPSVLIHIANYRVLDLIKMHTLQRILFAGEVMPNRHLNYWRRKLPHALFANLYGPTEITVDCTCYIVDREFEDSDVLPVGSPCNNTSIIILNNENKKTAVNETGEICVRGSSLFLGYWNDPEKTDNVLMQNPLTSNYRDNIYRTGDLAYYNERDEIIFVGRKDMQIKHMGHRIEPGEIENAVTSIKGMDKACVIYDSEKKEIILLYEASGKQETASIRKKLLLMIPKYMIPKVILPVENIPLNANGKIDRTRIKNDYINKMAGVDRE